MNEKDALISIIIPVYNAEKTIYKCLDSVTRQTYSNIEIIIINDGSTDPSGKICNEFAKTDKRIRLRNIENAGVVAARKVGLSMATGSYIAFVDSDDYIDVDMLEKLYAAIQSKDYDVSICRYIIEKENKINVTEDNTAFEKNLESSDERVQLIASMLLEANWNLPRISYNLWTKLYKADLIKKTFELIPEDMNFGEDLLCNCLVLLKVNGIIQIEDTLYHYVIRENSLTNTPDMYRRYFNEVKLCTCLIGVLSRQKNWETTQKSLLRFFDYRLGVAKRAIELGYVSDNFYFPDESRLLGKKVAIYGMGLVGKAYYQQFSGNRSIQIVAWVDRLWTHNKDDLIQSPDILTRIDYDVIIIAVKDVNMAEEIRTHLLKKKICEEKIVWVKPEIYG